MWLLWVVAAAIVLRLTAQLVLARLNATEVHRRAADSPRAFDGVMDEASYRKSVDYTLAKNRFGMVSDVWEAVVLAAVLFSGLLPWAWSAWTRVAGSHAWSGAVFFIAAMAALSVPRLPLDWWAQFRLETRFGFNRSPLRLWVTDRIKALILLIGLGLPLMWLLLQLVEWFGTGWWLAGWVAFVSVQLLLIVLYPMLILPWFNTLTPLPEGDLRARLLALAARAQFSASTVQVMDGSRRSSHSNAFFTGFGRARRIVLYDTLLQQLAHPELEAVLAHEIGHYKLGHIPRMLAWSAAVTLCVFAAIGWLSGSAAFFRAFGFAAPHPALAFVLVVLLGGLVGYWLAPVANVMSRRHEYQADAFARRMVGRGEPMVDALRKLTRENLSNLTPHPAYSMFYYSHPTLAERESALRQA